MQEQILLLTMQSVEQNCILIDIMARENIRKGIDADWHKKILAQNLEAWNDVTEKIKELKNKTIKT